MTMLRTSEADNNKITHPSMGVLTMTGQFPRLSHWALLPLFVLLVLFLPHAGFAQTPAPKIDSGDTAWMLISTALVLLMLIPGLALFYGGMVSKESGLG